MTERRPEAILDCSTCHLLRAKPQRQGAKPARPADAVLPPPAPSSYDQITPVLLGQQTFQASMAKDKADKPSVTERQTKLLEKRYDFTSRPDKNVSMSRGKPLQV